MTSKKYERQIQFVYVCVCEYAIRVWMSRLTIVLSCILEVNNSEKNSLVCLNKWPRNRHISSTFHSGVNDFFANKSAEDVCQSRSMLHITLHCEFWAHFHYLTWIQCRFVMQLMSSSSSSSLSQFQIEFHCTILNSPNNFLCSFPPNSNLPLLLSIHLNWTKHNAVTAYALFLFTRIHGHLCI